MKKTGKKKNARGRASHKHGKPASRTKKPMGTPGSGTLKASIACSPRDVTEQKRTEEALRKESTFISAVLDTVGAIVLVLDHEGRIVRFNRSCEQVSRYRFEEVKGRFVWDFLLPPEQIEPVKSVFRNLNAGRFPSQYENYWVAKNGEKRLIAWSNTVLLDKNGSVEYVVPTGIDITERATIEEALRDREERYRLLFHRSPIGIFNFDKRLHVTDCNDSFVAILRSSRERLLGIDMNRLEDRRVLPALRAAVNGEEGFYEGFYRATTSEAEVCVSLRTAPLYDRKGAIIGGVGIVEDITERKQAERSLQDALQRAEEEKNKSAAIIAALGDGISIQDREFRVVYQNEYHKKLIGNHLGEFCYEAYQRKDDVCEGCPVAMSFLDGNVHTVERSSTVPGRTIHVEVTSSPLRDSSGNIIAGIEVARDITDRKKAEQTLIEWSRHAMLGADIGITLTRGNDLQPILQACAEAMVRHLDAYFARIWTLNIKESTLELQASAGAYTRRDGPHGRIPLDQHDYKIGRIAKDRKPHLTNAVIGDPLISDQKWAKREGIVAFAGHPLVVEDKLVGVMGMFAKKELSEAALQALSSVADEIALGIERKRMEKERENLIRKLQNLVITVSRSQKQWRDTFDSIRDPIYIIDREYRIIKANKAFVEFVGRSFPEILNMKCYELLHASAAPYLHCPRQSIKDVGNTADVEIVDPKTKRTLVISHFPYLTPEGVFSGSISIGRDVTEEREKEMRYIMNERLASLGQMAASIAHEINNPLAAIMGCAEGLLNRVNQQRYDPVLFTNYLKIVEEEIARCKQITTGMLSFVRKSSPEKKAIDIRETLDRTIEIIGLQGRLKEVEVVKRYRPERCAVQGNEGELKQVFLAVVTNALDAMRDKGRLTIETGTEKEVVSITIHDTGEGIPAGQINRIFDPFFTTKTEHGGTGLGLSIAKKILSNHNGDIQVLSERGKGTTFTITLPKS